MFFLLPSEMLDNMKTFYLLNVRTRNVVGTRNFVASRNVPGTARTRRMQDATELAYIRGKNGGIMKLNKL